jgi:uncharacterized protein
LIYLHSSALVKLVISESESEGLAHWLSERADTPMVSSIIHRTEVSRAVWRTSPEQLPRCYLQMHGVEIVALSRLIAERAATITPSELRSADAIHLASALAVREHLAAFVAYDKRLLAAAEQAGLPIACPA